MAHGLSCSKAFGIFPNPGIEPVSPALVGKFLTTGPPGKSTIFSLRNTAILFDSTSLKKKDLGFEAGAGMFAHQYRWGYSELKTLL